MHVPGRHPSSAATGCHGADGATLDLRALPPPEPLLRALAAADALPHGAELVVLTPMLPLPLLQELLAHGLRADAELLDDGSARVRVRRP